jgi:D-glycero-beta-D-manno-heptose-7-phosphate kinase
LTLATTDPTKIVDGFRGKSILVVGDLIVDRYVHSQGRKLSREAPVPVADFISEELLLGGASNLTNNLVALGAKVKVLGVVGKDEAGRWLVEELQRRGVDTSGVVVNDRPTSLKTRFILNHRQYLRIDKEYRSDVEPHVTKQFLTSLKEHVKNADGVVFSDYDKGVLTPELISNVVEECRVQRKKVLAQPKVRHYLDYIGVTMVKSNAHEGSVATGISMINDTSLRNMGHNLMSRLECESVLLTRSERGMILFEKKNITSFPPFKGPKAGFNAVGVRDCMTAVLAMSLASNAPIPEAVLLAGLAAAQQEEKIGTAVVDLNELRSQASTTLELAEQIVQVPVH